MSKLSFFAKSKAAQVCYVVLTAVLGSSGLSAACLTDNATAGCVHYAQRTGSDFDKYIAGPTSTQQWIDSHFWRMQTSSGWFDRNLTWYKGAWAYFDSYAIYKGSDLADQHPDWILRDKHGNPLYIPWGCSNGSCPQYAADIANADYRNYWIAQAKAIIAAGYKGLWIDDVNLVMQVANGDGKTVAPIDQNTGERMTTTAWEKYFADFMTQVRKAVPSAEILHNSIWYAGTGNPGSDPYVQQEIKAANYINRERGISDGGITGDNGYWSLQSFFRFVDTVHSLGGNIDIQEFDFTGDYAPACYFMISQGVDALGNNSVTPSNWPANYDVDLGSPQGPRYVWNGLLRRDFDNGSVFVNPPQQPTVNAKLGSGYKNVDGKTVSTVTLKGKQGLILLRSGPATPTVQQPLADGLYKITNLYSSMVLDDSANSHASGQQIIQWPSNGGANQRWYFAFDGAGSFTIQNKLSGLYLADVAGKLQQMTKAASASQLWSLDWVSGGYVITNRGSGKVLDDPAQSLTKGTGIITWSSNNQLNQTWDIR